MLRRPPGSTRTARLFPDTAPVRSRHPDAVSPPPDRRGAAARLLVGAAAAAVVLDAQHLDARGRDRPDRDRPVLPGRAALHAEVRLGADHGSRSEEHTSELQSLMRTAYAVVCLKQKNRYLIST